jgi:3-oxosteroid 1-dehydrogenase
VAALAAAMGVPADVLEEEVARFSANARQLVDPDFGRGTVWFEGFTGGGPKPELSLAPIDEAPFYALRMYDGALGTAGGLAIDRDARVLSMTGEPIEGLYAAGNAAASLFGPTYPSGGVTLGPALTFGYLAGRHLAGVSLAPTQTQEVSV